VLRAINVLSVRIGKPLSVDSSSMVTSGSLMLLFLAHDDAHNYLTEIEFHSALLRPLNAATLWQRHFVT
jgi:hypothetical protein